MREVVYTGSTSNTGIEKDIRYYYDASGFISSATVYTLSNGNVTGTYTYLYRTNIQGDVVGIYTTDGTLLASYVYDAWGNFTETVHSTTTEATIASSLPFRYRSYYYDAELGMYYLNTRYYDSAIGRFINADDTSIITVSPEAFTDKNLYAYCDNNPVMRTDDGGKLWLTAALTSAAVGAIFSAVSDVVVQLATTGKVDVVQTLISAASGAISGACALIPGGKVLTTLVSGAINAGLSAGTYALNQYRKGENINKNELAINAGIGFASGVVGNLFRNKSTGNIRSEGKKLITKGHRKIDNGILNSAKSTIKRGFEYIDSGIDLIRKYSIKAGVNSGVGSAVGNVLSGGLLR